MSRQTRPENRPNAVNITMDNTQSEEDNASNEPPRNDDTDDNHDNDDNEAENEADNDTNNDTGDTGDNDNTGDTGEKVDSDDSGSDTINNSGSSHSDVLDSTENENNDTNFEDQFACSECEFKSVTAHGLFDHKEIHTSYADRAKSPPRTEISSSQPAQMPSYQQSNYANDKKRAASSSPNSSNRKSSKAQKKPIFKTVSRNYTFFKL